MDFIFGVGGFVRFVRKNRWFFRKFGRLRSSEFGRWNMKFLDAVFFSVFFKFWVKFSLFRNCLGFECGVRVSDSGIVVLAVVVEVF